jgi:hypothetical protein
VTPAEKVGFKSRSFDAVNFLLADVRGALGPYLNVFLVTRQHWSPSEVGLVTTIGAVIDETHARRRLRGADMRCACTGPVPVLLCVVGCCHAAPFEDYR